jgi:phospho-N-acetylmuramoyl-pentapeptide-transferase
MLYLKLILVFLFTLLSGLFITVKLRKLKLEQTIREDGPQSHFKKQGTPSMGGIIFLIPIVMLSLFYLTQSIIPLLALVGYGIIGIYDDLDKRVINSSGGLTVKKKLSLEIIMGLIIGIITVFYMDNTTISLTDSISINVNWFIYAMFIAIFLIAVTNGTNLTDGLDGLAILTAVPIFILFIAISIQQENYILAEYNALIIFALLGFLVFNIHPAKIFMGDTGSLALGALIAGMSILLNIELLLIIFGFIYVIESMSVLMQVSYFKSTGGKRLFKMAPLHHHYELLGWSETKVVSVFTLVSFIASFLAYIIYIVL